MDDLVQDESRHIPASVSSELRRVICGAFGEHEMSQLLHADIWFEADGAFEGQLILQRSDGSYRIAEISLTHDEPAQEEV